jgi:hypothetical protein
VPGLLGVRREDVVIVRIKGHVVLINVGVQLICTNHLGNLDELVLVVLALEERFLLKDLPGKHAAEGPNVQTVVVGLEIDQELGAFEVAACNPHVVLLTGMVELG